MRGIMKIVPLLFIAEVGLTQTMWEVTAAHIKTYEGFRDEAYYCAAGYKTIGWGQLTDLDKVTLSEANRLFVESFQRKYDWASNRFPSFDRNEKMALASLAYRCRMHTFEKSRLLDAILEYKNFPDCSTEQKLKNIWKQWSRYITSNPKSGKGNKVLRSFTKNGKKFYVVQNEKMVERADYEVSLFLYGDWWVRTAGPGIVEKYVEKYY